MKQYESTLQLVLASLCESLGLPGPNQAAAFLTQENKYLKHACSKGLKGGDFKPIIKWYETIILNAPQL